MIDDKVQIGFLCEYSRSDDILIIEYHGKGDLAFVFAGKVVQVGTRWQGEYPVGYTCTKWNRDQFKVYSNVGKE